jgi:hypothetical protein
MVNEKKHHYRYATFPSGARCIVTLLACSFYAYTLPYLTSLSKISYFPIVTSKYYKNADERIKKSFLRAKNFRGQHGKAYLFSTVVNIREDSPVERNMTTGRHVVRDITCRQCDTVVGWKYDKAFEAQEQYKENKFILEAELLVQVRSFFLSFCFSFPNLLCVLHAFF